VIKSFDIERAAARSGVLLLLAFVPVFVASAVERRQRR
jgi:ABC-type sulfate transport system permease component